MVVLTILSLMIVGGNDLRSSITPLGIETEVVKHFASKNNNYSLLSKRAISREIPVAELFLLQLVLRSQNRLIEGNSCKTLEDRRNGMKQG